ncbi:hypothetical protein [Deinococcus radiotolerans]|uniref:Uncharacterized protein n=1 Tax=Deinococcus radiotolerans TaxID=1309407 RepID=A0ABQ2FN35_9DEIO|nr:hypothetical protein [Deinococcus radiotolerans]GGL10315.1 hypothetical protein GCM10010844_31230 [Deinococcus radiotolerans]
MDTRQRTGQLRRRNALWQQLRTQAPGTPHFEATLNDLSTLTGWERPRILAGLGHASADAQAVPGAQEDHER